MGTDGRDVPVSGPQKLSVRSDPVVPGPPARAGQPAGWARLAGRGSHLGREWIETGVKVKERALAPKGPHFFIWGQTVFNRNLENFTGGGTENMKTKIRVPIFLDLYARKLWED